MGKWYKVSRVLRFGSSHGIIRHEFTVWCAQGYQYQWLISLHTASARLHYQLLLLMIPHQSRRHGDRTPACQATLVTKSQQQRNMTTWQTAHGQWGSADLKMSIHSQFCVLSLVGIYSSKVGHTDLVFFVCH